MNDKCNGKLEVDIICPECWHEYTITEEEADEMIVCPSCGHEFYEDESVTD